jgi:hypothetical protein
MRDCSIYLKPLRHVVWVRKSCRFDTKVVKKTSEFSFPPARGEDRKNETV